MSNSTFQKEMYINEEIACNANNSLKWKYLLKMMRSATFKKASQEEQQNYTTLTTKINYIQILMTIKKTYWLVKITSDKTETKQNNLNITRKNLRLLHNMAR